MICFPNGKINLGLQVLSKRSDGFHNIESLIYPIPLKDVLEFVPAKSFQFDISGMAISGNKKDNLIWKAWELLKREFKLPPLHVHLHKAIPTGSGMGGGSADAAFFLRESNEFFKLGMNDNKMKSLAGLLGSDCPFFIENKPAFVSGKGEILQSATINLRGKYLLIIMPETHISSQKAYSLVQPEKPDVSLSEIISKPISQWKNLLKNDFEKPIFSLYPELGNLKKSLYENGAVYASMTGSGSAIYGLFENEPVLKDINPNNYLWSGKL